MADRNGGAGFGIGFIVGAAIGVAIGLLFAPRPGAETRQMLREKAEVAKGRAVEAARKVRDTAGEAVKRARAKMQEA
jgi:gas vesicle protein